jgi:hypothetical protein
MFESSVASYPQRGVGGNPRYHGNCSPLFIRDYLLSFQPQGGLVIDPFAGSGTTGDVVKQLARTTEKPWEYKGFDLKDGFDSRRQRLLDHLPRRANAAMVHPPYGKMVRYSANVWGDGKDHPADLSRAELSVDQWAQELQEVLYNVYDALEIGGTYAVLLGLYREPRTGELQHLPGRILPLAPGRLENEIVKLQHNCRSNGKSYKTTVLTMHEICFVFRKTESGLFGSMLKTIANSYANEHATWKTVIGHLLRTRKQLTLKEAYAILDGHPITRNNKHVDAKVRQTFQKLAASGRAIRTSPGVYVDAASNAA